MAQEITVGGVGLFKPTALGTSKSYVLNSTTSPLVLTPPAGKVIRLDYFGFNGQQTLDDVYIEVGGVEVVRGTLAVNGSTADTFQIGRAALGIDNRYAWPAGHKEPIVAFEKDQSISISTTTASNSAGTYYSVSYGDL